MASLSSSYDRRDREGNMGRAPTASPTTFSRKWVIPDAHVGAHFGYSRGSPRYSDRAEMPVPLSAPGVSRTPDLQVRSLTLYPAELRARATKSGTYQLR